MGRPDDAIVLSLFKGVDRWMLGVDDADAIALHPTADCRDESGETIAHSVESLVKMAHDAHEDPKTVEKSTANERPRNDHGPVRHPGNARSGAIWHHSPINGSFRRAD